MALQEVTRSFLRRVRTAQQPIQQVWGAQCRQYATAESVKKSKEVNGLEMERSDFQSASGPSGKAFDPVGRARRRNRQLPPSR